MDITTLSRWQFGITTVYHFFFVPLTLGLSVLVAIMETMYLTKSRKFTRKWQNSGNAFPDQFCMGVVTLVQEFQFV
jgi:cytochrome d ubiquinol oxidase subunit I